MSCRPATPQEPGVERVACAGGVHGGDRQRRDAQDGPVRTHAQRPSPPSFTATVRAGPAAEPAPSAVTPTPASERAASSTSAWPVSRVPCGVGQQDVGLGGGCREPVVQVPDGSQFGSRLVCCRRVRGAEQRRNVRRERSLEEEAAHVDWRARASRAAGTSTARRSAIVPVAVRIARSLPLPRMTDAPVGLAGSTRHADTSTPVAAIASSMNLPSASAPTTRPGYAQAEPRRPAGGDRGRAADREADPLDDPFCLPEDRTWIGVRDHHVGVDLADHEQVDVALPATPLAGISGGRDIELEHEGGCHSRAS